MSQVEAEVREEANGRAVVTLRGMLNAYTTADCWRELEQRLKKVSPSSVTVETGELELGGGIGAALLRYLAEGKMTPGARVELRGLSPQAESVLETFSSEDFRMYPPPVPEKTSVPAEVGSFVRGLFADLGRQITFLGSVLRAIPSALVRPKRLRWQEIRCVMERAGANALPVIAIINGLVGVVTVLEAAHPLAKFGAQIFLADMIGFSSLRDTGPLVTAILVAGRSGSAFAAELGTMKVNQELDALTTMGLNPVRFLVIQRIIAAVLLLPLLTLFAMLAAIIGGIAVMRSLGFPPLLIYHQLLTRVGMGDIGVGLTKALLFGVVVGGVACQRGLETGNGPSAVGESTTRSVISCIVLIIVANTAYSATQYFLS